MNVTAECDNYNYNGIHFGVVAMISQLFIHTVVWIY